MSQDIIVRKCESLDEFHRCVDLQREIWGEADLEVEPATMFVVAAHSGGEVLGAFDGDRLVGDAVVHPDKPRRRLPVELADRLQHRDFASPANLFCAVRVRARQCRDERRCYSRIPCIYRRRAALGCRREIRCGQEAGRRRCTGRIPPSR